MEQGEVEKELEELESRIERTRGLYEQYFMGIERLEPQTPRKDVDRRIRDMRKARLKNTAQRYKFNMLAQRYNTLSQYWGRIMRQIENGTYKRDVAKAAARFGADAALGALGGRKKDKSLENAAAEAEQKEAEKRKQRKDHYELDENDVNWQDDFDDEAPTPPPQQQPGAQPAPAQAPQEAYAQPANQYAADPHAGIPPAPPTHTQGSMPGAPQAQAGWPQDPAQAQAAPPAQAPPQQANAPIGAFGGLMSRQPPAAQQVKKAKGGLRWGGGGAKPRDPAATKEKLASLAAQVREASPSQPEIPPAAATPPPAAKPPPPPPPKSVRGPLISSPFGIDLGDGGASGNIPPAKTTEPGLGPPPPKSRPLPKPVPPPRASQPGAPPAAATGEVPAAKPPPPKPPPSQRRPAAAEPSKPRSAPKPKPAARPAAKKSGKESLDDQRLRQIYSEYVETKRKANESTAGITYEKLADSLRVQTDKLKQKHNNRKVDYQVVVKNGKTLIKPVIK